MIGSGPQMSRGCWRRWRRWASARASRSGNAGTAARSFTAATRGLGRATGRVLAGRDAYDHRHMHDPVRILHTPTNVANNPYSLSRAERALGFESDVVDFAPATAFGFQADEVHDLAGRPFYVHLYRRGSFLARAMRHYDVFHFN